MNPLVVVALVSGAFVLGFGLGRETLHVRRRASRTAGLVSRLTPPSARPTLRVITGGRVRRSAEG
jgi:hypothetical protein